MGSAISSRIPLYLLNDLLPMCFASNVIPKDVQGSVVSDMLPLCSRVAQAAHEEPDSRHLNFRNLHLAYKASKHFSNTHQARDREQASPELQ